MYPYGIFRVQPDLSAESGLSAERSVLCQQAKPAVYLTFDDGPIPEVTPLVLDILSFYDVKATFFMVGENIDKHPDIFRDVVKAGHSIGNHTYNHLKGWRTSFSDYMDNVDKWEETVEKQSSNLQLSNLQSSNRQSSNLQSSNRQSSNRQLFRPPYGKATLRQRIALHQRGYQLIYWDILTRDYDAARTPQAMLAQIKKETRPGSIINFHDSLKSDKRMLAILPDVIEWLQKEDYDLRAL